MLDVIESLPPEAQRLIGEATVKAGADLDRKLRDRWFTRLLICNIWTLVLVVWTVALLAWTVAKVTR